MFTRFLTSILLIWFFIALSGQVMAQTNGCGTCLTAMPDSLVTSATLYLSWNRNGDVQTGSFAWQPGDIIEVACGDMLTPLASISYAISESGDTVGVEWGSQVEIPTYYNTYPRVNNIALLGRVDSIPEANCTIRIVNYQHITPDEGYQCGEIIYGGSAITSREMIFPVGSGRVTIDFQAYGIVDTLVIMAGGEEVFHEPIGTQNGGKPPENVIWENGVIREFSGTSEIPTGGGFIRVIIDVEDNCNLSVLALSNMLPGTAWRLYVHCCPECYNPPLKALTIDTTVCETGTFFGQTLTEDGEVSQLTQTRRGCDSLTTYSVHVAKPRIQSIQVTDALCFGSADGQLLAFVNAENPTLAWNTGATTSLAEGLVAGDYALTITDQYGCTRSGSASVGEPTKLTASFNEQLPSCYGFQNGELRIIPDGGTPGYTVLWSDGRTDRLIDSLASGYYYPTITDAHECLLETSYFLDQPDTLIVDLNVDKATCRGIPDGTAKATTSGGTYPYAWEWRDIGTGDDIRDELLNGPYYVTVTDVNGCIDSSYHLLHYAQEDQTYIPNTFSPNGDGRNDQFLPMGGDCIREINYFAVFDRWGAQVYEKQDFQAGDPSAGWDGTHKGRKLNPGLYIWRTIITYHSGYVEKRNGDVTLMR